MTIVKGWPPNIDQIDAALNVRGTRGLIFSYGHTVYVPDGGELSAALRAHEAVHGERQGDTIATIQAWWARYLVEPEFRYAEELPAHVAEYRAFCAHHGDSNMRARYLHRIGQRLGSKLYGGLIKPARAMREIKAAAR
jgi:hypothetical protein